MVTTLIDFYITVIPIAAWVAYKEPSWINAGIWIVLLVCFGRACCIFSFNYLCSTSTMLLVSPDFSFPVTKRSCEVFSRLFS
ncbi:hypothetical protein GIB67_022644 [Kingdonia uniflora]|uniref:Uncharacterized protein n=1 Tax=Kingdonia uniflora TaxID=39325 RepID=A0A7J7P8N7_9MAGN|nr:hypothetical protein GIB67_022644 [Kingdonia uniflora]